MAPEPEAARQIMDERTEADALHYATNVELEAGHSVYRSAVAGNFRQGAVSKFK